MSLEAETDKQNNDDNTCRRRLYGNVQKEIKRRKMKIKEDETQKKKQFSIIQLQHILDKETKKEIFQTKIQRC